MTSRVWLDKDEHLRPGAELFRTERLVALWSYSATHGQLLWRADRMPGADQPSPTTIEVLFTPAEAVRIETAYRGLVIRCATEEEAARIDGDVSDWCRQPEARVFVLESEGTTGYVVAHAVGWCEGVLSDLEPSFYNVFGAYDPEWPVAPLAGVGDSSGVASPREVAEALLTGLPEGVRRERYRYVHLLTVVTERDDRQSRRNAGVFLTEADAEEAKRLVEPHVARCWIEPLPMVL